MYSQILVVLRFNCSTYLSSTKALLWSSTLGTHTGPENKSCPSLLRTAAPRQGAGNTLTMCSQALAYDSHLPPELLFCNIDVNKIDHLTKGILPSQAKTQDPKGTSSQQQSTAQPQPSTFPQHIWMLTFGSMWQLPSLPGWPGRNQQKSCADQGWVAMFPLPKHLLLAPQLLPGTPSFTPFSQSELANTLPSSMVQKSSACNEKADFPYMNSPSETKKMKWFLQWQLWHLLFT